MEGNQLFPVFIKLDTIHTLLIGAGPIGLEKLTAILDNSPGARVTVVASVVSSELREKARLFGGVQVFEKAFEPSDLEGIDLVIAATNNAVLNEEVKLLAKSRNLLANFADKPELCSFYLGSVVKKGDLKIAISTNGKSPTIAKRLKEVLNDSLPEELNDTLQQMQALRNTLQGDFASKVKALNEVTASLVKESGLSESMGNVGHSDDLNPALALNGLAVSSATKYGDAANSPGATNSSDATNFSGSTNFSGAAQNAPVNPEIVGSKDNRVSLKWLIWLAVVFSFAIVITAFWNKEPEFQAFVQNINPIFYWFLLGGFIFSMIDGAIGMSYGVTSTSFSLAMGVPPASASMGVHLSEILSNGIAGWMHYRFGNVNWKLFKLLLIPGILGAVTGAYLLSSLEHYSNYTKPFVSLYTLILGGVILSKALKPKAKGRHEGGKIKKISLLGAFGGFIDAVGGGGWGSIVLSSLIAGGRSPRFSLGTVKITRFFIALMSSLTFITMLNGKHWEAVAGLVIGSALASPIAAKVSNKISAKAIMLSVGVIVILVSLRSIVNFIIK